LGIWVVGVLAAGSVFSFGQSSDVPSLGDVARKQREKQQGKDSATKPKKVVTDEDMPKHAAADEGEDAAHTGGPHDEISVQRSATDVLQTGDQWKAAIARQKETIADLKERIDKLNSSIHYVTANAYRNGVAYNKHQEQKQQEVDRLQGQLKELTRDLEQMQESARKAGYGSAVWDP
jgi:predicted RNase H-like nuclease (RuvC/YqgF family)